MKSILKVFSLFICIFFISCDLLDNFVNLFSESNIEDSYLYSSEINESVELDLWFSFFYEDDSLTEEEINARIAELSYKTIWLSGVIDLFENENPNITINFEIKENHQELKDDYLSYSTENRPDLLLTTSDYSSVFAHKNLLEPLDLFVNLSLYTDGYKSDNYTWEVPFSNENFLVLYYNRSLLDPPQNSTSLLELDNLLVYDRYNPDFFFPWCAGFNVELFSSNGVTPTLNSEEMVSALTFYKILYQNNSGYINFDSGENGFLDGTQAMIINYFDSLDIYKDVLNDNLAITRIPRIYSTDRWPKPYITGQRFLVTKDLLDVKKIAAAKVIKSFTSSDTQKSLFNKFNEMPGLLSAFSISGIENDPLLKKSSYQLEIGVTGPSHKEMDAVYNAIENGLVDLLNNGKTPQEVAQSMQTAAVLEILTQ